jgi:hypothetical protein
MPLNCKYTGKTCPKYWKNEGCRGCPVRAAHNARKWRK